MKIWIILLAIAMLQIVTAIPVKDAKNFDFEGELSDILANIPEDINADDILRFLYDIMNREVSLIFIN